MDESILPFTLASVPLLIGAALIFFGLLGYGIFKALR